MKGGISDRQYLIGSLALTGLLVAVITVLAGVFMLRVWAVGDTWCFYAMAEVILRGGTPYVDYLDPKPPLIFFLLTLPLAIGHKIAGGLALVAIANFASAAILLVMGWKLYGRKAGFVAAVLFAINFSLAEGYFVITEPFTVTFILLSAYFLVCGPESTAKRYLLAGLAAGLAIGFKQYALLLLPPAVYLLWRKKEYSGLLPFLAGGAVPLAIMFCAIFVVYGFPVGEAALHWSFGVAGSYVTEGDVEGVPAYKIDDPVIALSWFALGLSLFSPLLLFAGASLLDRKVTLAGEFFALSGVAFAATLAIRPFLHYWALALPFIILLAVSGLSGGGPRRAIEALRAMSDRVFLCAAGALYSLLLLVSTAVSTVLVDALWRPLEIWRFYGLADIVLKATNPYLVHVPEPSLARVDLFPAGQSAAIGLIVAASLVLCAALLLTRLGMDIYGRRVGFSAGTVLVVCMAWVLGCVSVSDTFALLFLVAALYAAAGGTLPRYLLSGICLGAAIALKPLALLVLPALAYLTFSRGGLRSLAGMVAAALALPVAVAAALSWLFPGAASTLPGVSVFMVPLTAHEGGYVVTDPLIAMLNIAIAAVMLTIILPVAAVALARRPCGHFEVSLLLAGFILLLTLPAGLYVHYWFLALPFLALASASALLYQPAVAGEDRKT